MELHAVQRILLVAKSHDFLFCGLGGDEQAVWQGVPFDDQGMVARRFEGLTEALEDPFRIVVDHGGFPVHQAIRAHHVAAEDFAHALMSQTNAEDGPGGGKLADHGTADTRFRWRARSRRDADAFRIQGRDFFQSNGVVPLYQQSRAQLAEVLDEVVGEGVVVIDDKQHAGERVREIWGRRKGKRGMIGLFSAWDGRLGWPLGSRS